MRSSTLRRHLFAAWWMDGGTSPRHIRLAKRKKRRMTPPPPARARPGRRIRSSGDPGQFPRFCGSGRDATRTILCPSVTTQHPPEGAFRLAPVAEDDISRRSVLKQAAVGGVGLVAGSVLTDSGNDQASAAIEQVTETQTWLADRASCISGNRLLVGAADGSTPVRTKARAIYRPRSAREIADLVRSLPAGRSP